MENTYQKVRSSQTRKSVSIILMGVILGVYFSFRFAAFLVPGGFVISLLIMPFLGMVWPYLSKRQNIMSGIVRYLLAAPSLIMGSIRACAMIDLRLGVLLGAIDVTLVPKLNATLREELFQAEETFLTAIAPTLTLAKSALWWVNIVLFPLYIMLPYLFHLYLKRKSIYKQMPIKFRKE